MSACTTTSEVSLWARQCSHCFSIFTERLLKTCACQDRFYCDDVCQNEDAKIHHEICAFSSPNPEGAIEERARRESIIRMLNKHYAETVVPPAIEVMVSKFWREFQHLFPLPPFSSIDWNDIFHQRCLSVHITYRLCDTSDIPPALTELIPALANCERYTEFDIHKATIFTIDSLEPSMASRVRQEYLEKAPAIIIGFSVSRSIGPFSTTGSTPFIIPYVHHIREDFLDHVYRDLCEEIAKSIATAEGGCK